MDMYSTGSLERVVAQMIRPQEFFLNKFFTTTVKAKEDKIFFDVEVAGKKRRLSPYVHPLMAGKLVESAGYTTESFTPPYIKDKRVHDATRPFQRAIGERIGGDAGITPMDRQRMALDADLADQLAMLTRTMESQAVESLRDGTVTVKMKRPDDTTETKVITFGRDADLQITKGAGTRWGESGVKPTKDLRDWALLVLKKSGSRVQSVIHDVAAWEKYLGSADVEKTLDLSRIKSGEIDLNSLPDHVQYMGKHGGFDHWVYTEWYYDEGTSAEVSLLDSGRVIGVGDVLGVRHFGAIKDEAAGFKPVEYFPKSWVTEDPSVRFLLMQSAPLMVPYRINASFSAKVLA